MLLSKCAICGSKKSNLMKKQESGGLFVSRGFKTHLSKIPLFGVTFF